MKTEFTKFCFFEVHFLVNSEKQTNYKIRKNEFQVELNCSLK